jgi:hypothetical protein
LWNLLRRARGPEPGAAPEPAPFDAGARGEWRWAQPARFRPAWTLAVDDTVVGTMALRGVLQQTAEVRVGGATWTIRPRLLGDALVFAGGAEGAGTPSVHYRPGWWGGGRVEREGRETLLWRHENLWRMHWGLYTSEKSPLVHVQPHLAPFRIRRECRVELEDAARRLEDLGVLIALGWYLALRSQQSHAANA